MTQELIL